MCGICGKVIYGTEPIDKTLIQRMAQTLYHRGPDARGFYLNPSGTVGLGHQRLSIIDLTSGNQPLSNEDGSIWIVFNGEIYNFQDLRSALIKKGHTFKTRADTEVIVHAYEEYGENCVEKFNGMFAFAIWNEKTKSLFLARDRFGEKPLFYTETKEGFIFASELKAILSDTSVAKEINNEAVSHYFSLGYILAPHTIIKNVRKLPAGHLLTVKEEGIRIKQYWDIPVGRKQQIDIRTCIDKLSEEIKRSVRMRLVGDVPVGAFLSGGIDSSLIVYNMLPYATPPVKTFSIGFEESSYNELSYANYAAECLNTHHYTSIVPGSLGTLLSDLVWYNDEPLADTSSVPMYHLSRLARNQVKVVLSGDGGDENFAGYDTYIADKLLPFYKKVPHLIRNGIIKRCANLFPTSFNKVSLSYKIKQFVAGADLSPEKAHYYWRVLFPNDEKKRLFTDDYWKSINSVEPYEYFESYFNNCRNASFLERSLYVDMKTWLTDDILTKVDRASMAHSLEVRIPFLDHELVEFVMTIPDNLKLRGFNKKYIFKRSAAGKLPSKIVYRKKEGFNAPVSHWFEKELREIARNTLLEPNILSSCHFRGEYISSLIDEHYRKAEDHGLKIWALLNFTLWHKRFMHDNS